MITVYTQTEPQTSCIYLYKEFCIQMLSSVQPSSHLSIYLDTDQPRDCTTCSLTVHINYEHTLVQEGGRGIKPNTEYTDLVSRTGKRYMLRIDKQEEWQTADSILDYSIPNIQHCKTSKQGWLKEKTHIYIPPLLFPLKTETANRSIQVLTTFLNIYEPRRYALLELFRAMTVPVINVNSVFSKNDTLDLYQNTRILINIHQTEDHHTFEELRCLPALLNGVLVISEDVPYHESIPYHEFIIWTTYDSIVQTTQEVMANYEDYRTRIFGDSKFKECIDTMQSNLQRTCQDLFKCIEVF